MSSCLVGQATWVVGGGVGWGDTLQLAGNLVAVTRTALCSLLGMRNSP